jgi:hypothetical protein
MTERLYRLAPDLVAKFPALERRLFLLEEEKYGPLEVGSDVHLHDLDGTFSGMVLDVYGPDMVELVLVVLDQHDRYLRAELEDGTYLGIVVPVGHEWRISCEHGHELEAGYPTSALAAAALLEHQADPS